MNKQKQNQAILLGLGIIVMSLIGIFLVEDLTYKLIIGVLGLALLWLTLRFFLKKPKAIDIGHKDYQSLAKDLISYLGGQENITHVDHCQTRVLLGVVDSKLASVDEIRQLGISGVLRPSNTKVQLIVKDLVEPITTALRNELKHD